jgi:hypothetical protein
VLYVVYTINRTHVPRSAGKTAYEMVYNKVPDVTHLMSFFGPGVYYLTKEERKGKAWTFKAEPCHLLGYSEDGKGSYIVVNTNTGKVVWDRADCVFDESFYEVLRENQRNPDSHLIHELFDKLSPVGWMSDEAESIPKADEPIPSDKDETRAKRAKADGLRFLDKGVKDVETSTRRLRSSDKNESESLDEGVTDDEAAVTSADFGVGYFPDFFASDPANPVSVAGASVADSAQDFDEIKESADHLQSLWLSASAAALSLSPLPYSPKSVEEALSGPDKAVWHSAIHKELQTMERLGVMEVAEKQEGHGMKMKMTLRTAYNNDFSVKYKARLVICGYS